MLSIIIPSFNRRDQILILLRDIYAQELIDFEVIVVDDNSCDESVKTIAHTFKQTKILVNTTNCGPATSRNRGVRAAKGEFIIGIDSDVTIPNRNLFAQIVDTFNAEPQIACLALRILGPNGDADDVDRWCHPFPICQASGSRLTTYFSGTGFAMRRESMLRAGLFPELFYMHHEEVELGYRLLDQGDSILYCANLSINHHVAVNATRSYVESYYHPRNQILLVVHSFPWLKGLLHLLPRTIYQMGLAVKNRTLNDYLNALVSASLNLGNVLAIRKPLKRSTFETIANLKSR